MVFRRVFSAPANLSKMGDRRPILPQRVIDRASRVLRRGDALNEMTYSVEEKVHVTDTTEQLVLLLVVRRVLSGSKVRLGDLLYELAMRAAVSFVTHSVMNAILSRVNELPL
jgi:hypothetical protein